MSSDLFADCASNSLSCFIRGLRVRVGHCIARTQDRAERWFEERAAKAPLPAPVAAL